MTVLVFAGPTLPRAEIEAAGFVWRPPAAQGDVWRALAEAPAALGIVDGYFEGRPAVWHKEILWALRQGVPVFGAASMGALRAAELHGFGMQGVGEVFTAYRDGRLTADDEVAVLHGPSETGFVALSEPLVNIRATVRRAVAEQVLEPTAAERLIAAAKARHYKERRWSDLTGMAGARFAAWLAQGRVDQKRLDAQAMLAAIAAWQASGRPFEAPAFTFEATEFWQALAGSTPGSVGAADRAVLDELRLDPDAATYRAAALGRLLLLQPPGQPVPAASELRAALRAWREAHGLLRQADVARWCADNGLDAQGLERLMADEVLAAREADERASALGPHLLALLRLDGRYAPLARRAAEKAALLARAGLDEARPHDAPPPAQLRARFFARKQRMAMPDDLDRWLAAHGFANRDDFDRRLLHDWLYETFKEKNAGR
jgi:hypothetical protein